MHRLTDQAWVNDNDFRLFYSRDGKSLWYLSEQSGYSLAYQYRDGQCARLLQVSSEMNRLTQTHDGRWIYYRANKKHQENMRKSTASLVMVRGSSYDRYEMVAWIMNCRQLKIDSYWRIPASQSARLIRLQQLRGKSDTPHGLHFKEFTAVNWIVPDLARFVPIETWCSADLFTYHQDKSKLNGPSVLRSRNVYCMGGLFARQRILAGQLFPQK